MPAFSSIWSLDSNNFVQLTLLLLKEFAMSEGVKILDEIFFNFQNLSLSLLTDKKFKNFNNSSDWKREINFRKISSFSFKAREEEKSYSIETSRSI